MTLFVLNKFVQVKGQFREVIRAELKKRYEKGDSIRQLAEQTGRSYGFIHRMLNEAGVELRNRGGVNNKAGVQRSASKR